MKNDKSDEIMRMKTLLNHMEKRNIKPDSCVEEEQLAAYLEGNLKDSEKERIESHLADCDTCTETLLTVSALESATKMPSDNIVPEKAIQTAKNMVKTKQKAGHGTRIQSRPFWVRYAPAFAAMGVLIFISIGIFHMSGFDQGPDDPTSAFSLNLIARVPSDISTRGQPRQYKTVKIESGGVLHSGDMFQIQFRVPHDAYVYLLGMDSLGKITSLISGKHSTGYIQAQACQTYTFPKGPNFFQLDRHAGKEKIYLIADSEPIKDYDQKLERLKTDGVEKIHELFKNTTIQVFQLTHLDSNG